MRKEIKQKAKDKRNIHPSEHRVPKKSMERESLSNKCKEIEGSNRMGKTRDCFKKVTDTKGASQEKMGTIKDKNGMDLKEADDIRRGGKNTKKNYTQKILMT